MVCGGDGGLWVWCVVADGGGGSAMVVCGGDGGR